MELKINIQKGEDNMKKVSVMLLAMLIVLGIGTTTAFAYSGQTQIYIVDHGTVYQDVSENNYSVFATCEIPFDTYLHVKATTQRYYSGAWHNVESKWAYGEYSYDAHYNANFEFDNYAYKSQSIRIRFDYYDPWSGSYMTTGFSPTWVR